MNTEQLVATLYARGAQLAVQDAELLLSAPEGALDELLVAQVRAAKADIIALLGRLDQACEAGPALSPPARSPAYSCALSLAQQRMLFLEELASASSYYNMPLAFRIDGPLDKGALQLALNALVATHDVLRTVYGQADGQPVQHVMAPAPLEMAEHMVASEAELAALLALHADHRFALASAAPLRVALIALGAQQHVLSINLHHIAADGLSARKLLANLGAAYRHYCAHPDAATPALVRSWQYADYVAWQQAWIASPQYDAAMAYWLATLADVPQLHGIMPDYVRPALQSVAGSHLRLPLPNQLAQATAALARTRGTTPFVIYQAAFAALLARYGDTTDVVFGTAAANRQPAQFENTVGLFVNTLVLRFAVDEQATLGALIGQAKTVSGNALRHQQLPFDALVAQLRAARSLAANPLVQIMLVMQDEDGQALALDGARVQACEQQQSVSKFDFALHVRQRDGAVTLDWEYNTSLFAARTMAAMSANFVHLLQACVDGVDGVGSRIGAFALPGARTERDVPEPDLAGEAGAPQCVHHLFEDMAARQPQAVALIEGDCSTTYAELEQQAERVACHLAAAGVDANSAVGVCMEKSAALVIAMLAIYKVGATYVPLDPHTPHERLTFMLRDAGVAQLLTDGDGDGALATAAALPQLDLRQLLATPADVDYPLCASPSQGAYIIYTSGSTGQPKGVLVTHANLYYALHANRAAMGIVASDSMPTIGSQAFGVSLLEILLPLTSGGAVQLVTRAQVRDVEALVRVSREVTVLHAVPSLMRRWLDTLEAGTDPCPYPKLRLLLVGGESVPAGLLERIKRWRPSVRLLALYGMTESAIVCSSFEATLSPDRPAAHYGIGKPYRHARFYVLGSAGQEQPDGVPGELHIGGLSIAAGYVGLPALTAERFIASPFHPGERLYRSGDRVRRLADGSFEFLGRLDHQVSLRGARIELGEIETLANTVAGVSEAVAHVAGDDPVLVLFYTSPQSAREQAGEQAGIVAALRAQFERRLPDYMRPSIVQHLPAFPLNPNGKVDRKKLPSPQAADTMVAPAGDIERRLLAISHALLERSDFGVTANFFEVGGHSLLATRMATRIRAEFGIDFPLAALFSCPSVRACSTVVEAALRQQFAASMAGPGNEGLALEDEIVL